MSFALVTSATRASSNGNSVTTIAVNTTGATLIVIFNGTLGGIAPTDSKSNTWTALTASTSSFITGQLYYCINPTTDANHTFTINSTGSIPGIAVLAFSGGTSSFDVENGNTSSSATSLATNNVTPNVANEVVIAGLAIGFNGSVAVSINGGFSNIGVVDDGVNNIGANIAYLIQTTATAANPTYTNGGSATIMVARIAAFKLGTGGKISISTDLDGLGGVGQQRFNKLR